jgi:hypothetical protein
VASRYVTRDLQAFLENYSPLRQIEDGLSPGLTDGGEPRPGNKERGAPGSNEPESASFGKLVETGESRTPNTDHSIAGALRELSVCLVRLADTLDLTGHTGKHNQITDQ